MEKSALLLGGFILGAVGIATIACLDDKVQSPKLQRNIWDLVGREAKDNLVSSVNKVLDPKIVDTFEKAQSTYSKFAENLKS